MAYKLSFKRADKSYSSIYRTKPSVMKQVRSIKAYNKSLSDLDRRSRKDLVVKNLKVKKI
jgi:hypothetical protein